MIEEEDLVGDLWTLPAAAGLEVGGRESTEMLLMTGMLRNVKEGSSMYPDEDSYDVDRLVRGMGGCQALGCDGFCPMLRSYCVE